MGRNPLDGVPPSQELLERAAAAISREWGVSLDEARAAIERNTTRRQRVGPEIHAATAWLDVVIPEPRQPEINLTDWTLYLDHGELVYGRVE